MTLWEPADRDKTMLIDDAAQKLGVSRRTVYYRIREGRLQTIRTRLGTQRVLMSSLEMLLQTPRERSRPGESVCLKDQVAGA